MACVSASAQQRSEGRSVLASSLSRNGVPVGGIELSGTAEYILGSTDETGAFTASCDLSDQSKYSLRLSSKTYEESRVEGDENTSGTWTDEQGNAKDMALHNAVTPAAWYCPQVVVARILKSRKLSISEVVDSGDEDTANLIHLVVSPNAVSDEIKRRTLPLIKVDLYIDRTTQRLAAMRFNLHPDNNVTVDVPVEIRYSDYQLSGGVWVPHSIDKYVNNVPALKINIESATLR